jgi:hypothetical protein
MRRLVLFQVPVLTLAATGDRHMRRQFVASVPLLITLWCVAVPPSRAAAQTPGNPAEKEIMAVEQQEAQALLKGDTYALERLWAPDLLITASNNRIRSGTDVLSYMKSGKMKLIKLERNTERVSVHGQSGVAMGVETFVPGVGAGAGKTLRRRYTNVYLLQGERWRLIARQATLIPN